MVAEDVRRNRLHWQLRVASRSQQEIGGQYLHEISLGEYAPDRCYRHSCFMSLVDYTRKRQLGVERLSQQFSEKTQIVDYVEWFVYRFSQYEVRSCQRHFPNLWLAGSWVVSRSQDGGSDIWLFEVLCWIRLKLVYIKTRFFIANQLLKVV